MQDLDAPFGFSDGHIASYTAGPDSFVIEFEFWNGVRARFTFSEYFTVLDYGAVGAELSAAGKLNESPLIEGTIARFFEPTASIPCLCHYRFLDVDAFAVLEIVAKGCEVIVEQQPQTDG